MIEPPAAARAAPAMRGSSAVLDCPDRPSGPLPTVREQRRMLRELATAHADARIRRAVLDLIAVIRVLEDTTRPLGGLKGRARWLRAAAECTALDTLPRALQALRAGLAGKPAGEP